MNGIAFVGIVRACIEYCATTPTAAPSSDKSLDYATWGLFGATVLLAIVAFVQYLDGRLRSKDERDRWERAQEHHVKQEKQELLDKFVDRFNSAPMLIARAEFARQHLGSARSPSMSGVERIPNLPKFRFAHDVPPQTWTLLDFFERLARHWELDSIDIDAIDEAFNDYILVLCGEHKGQLAEEWLASKYAALNRLASELRSRHQDAATTPGMDEMSADWKKARGRFWYSEYKLFRLFPGALPELPEDSEDTVSS